MAEAEPQEDNYDNVIKTVKDVSRDLKEQLEEMEKLTVQAAWMTYNFVTIQTNPELVSSMKLLEDAFLRCKAQMEKKWQEVLKE
ncbi:SYCE3 protein, partial [Neodrepanis coruscans]|nr:SYCE3 protein [Neodrepanis coruscans]